LKKDSLLKKQIKYSALVIVSLILMSWGYQGHQIISGNAALSFNAEMEEFHMWVNALIDHASDADIRKQWDPDEGPRHYIDIDMYDEFQIYGTIPQDINDAIAIHGHDFVYEAGVLPWATKNTYDSLIACFQRLDWDKAVLYAADLGHYVGDGHMPLHITMNYNGQYTGNYDIHYRYESTMINAFGSQIFYEGDEISVIQDVQQYIFDYLYYNYNYVDSVLFADDYAKSISSNTSSSEYRQALWEKTKGFTTLLFKNASHTLAELIYSAWTEAGKPDLFTGPSIFTPSYSPPRYLEPNAPNPFSSSTSINFTLPSPEYVTLTIKDTKGNTVDILLDNTLLDGTHSFVWEPYDLSNGIYFIILETHGVTDIRKIILVN
jgi:hypothetical protein